jgi:hypothetical protein
MLHWNRYHLLPQLGLALLISGALPARLGARLTATLSRPQIGAIALLLGLCFLIQLPRSVVTYGVFFSPIDDMLQRIDQVDRCCQEHHISAAGAREVLGTLDLSAWCGEIDGWQLLRGSDEPHSLSVAERRRLLAPYVQAASSGGSTPSGP